MKICLAGLSSAKSMASEFEKCPYILESFYSLKDWEMPIIKSSKFFMLDSGAFSFMNSKKNEDTDFDAYLEKYIAFINENNIEHFFELDVDAVTGLEKVEQLRDRLEAGTGHQCIPVWHKSRGKEYFLQMCKDYSYISVGGIVTKEITQNDYPYFHWLINTAHEHACKIHGLGFTYLKGLYEYHFDSVDSTAWGIGTRYGTLFHFDGRNFKRALMTLGREVSSDKITKFNYEEWLKFQKYADQKL